MLKILLLMVALVSSLFSFNDDFEFRFNNESRNISINANFAEKLDPNSQDWIGIYKKGASNSWENVQQWTWVKPAMQRNDTYVELKLNLDDGEYEARYFLNNSYETFRAKAFTLKTIAQEASVSILLTPTKKTVYVDSTTSGADNKDWIGIYKKGASNSWNNVLAWTWCYWHGGNYGGLPPVININQNLANGDYEARLFYHNSYKLEAKAAFTIKDNMQDEIFPFNQNWDGREGYLVDYNYNELRDRSDKRWIGIFRQGAERNINNLIAWTWAGFRIEARLQYYKKNLLQADGTLYDIVYFKGTAYEQLGKTGTITIK